MKYVYWSSCKVHFILVGLQRKLNFLIHFREILIEFNENQPSGGRVVPCGWADEQKNGRMGRKTDITKLLVTFRNFANSLLWYDTRSKTRCNLRSSSPLSNRYSLILGICLYYKLIRVYYLCRKSSRAVIVVGLAARMRKKEIILNKGT